MEQIGTNNVKLIIINPIIYNPPVIKTWFVEKILELRICLFIFYCPHFYFASSVTESNWQTPPSYSEGPSVRSHSEDRLPWVIRDFPQYIISELRCSKVYQHK
jgi:hypothetical protein